MENLKVETIWYNDFKKELPNVEGKVFVVTGTTSGTGFIAARTAAELGGEVLLLNRKSGRATKALAKLQEEVPKGKFVPIECDLQSFESVRAVAQEILTKYDESGIYCVCWNAGIMATPDRATMDGFDEQMQTNHLSHFLLTAKLYPLLEKYATAHGDARIVNHSSGGRHMTPNKILERRYLEKNGGNLGGSEMRAMSGPCFERYFHTKLANAVFTQALHNKLQAKGSNIKALCADPGLSATSLANHFEGMEGAPDMQKFGEFFSQQNGNNNIAILRQILTQLLFAFSTTSQQRPNTRRWRHGNYQRNDACGGRKWRSLWTCHYQRAGRTQCVPTVRNRPRIHPNALGSEPSFYRSYLCYLVNCIGIR